MDLLLKNINFKYKNIEIYKDLNLNLKKGKVTVILGPSGCGKTTLLNLISGLITPNSGSIIIPPKTVLSYLFQDPRLLPWKTIEQNIKFVLKHLNKAEIDYRTTHFLTELGLEKFSKYYPSQLSGGMRQRVSIARAFAYPSNTLLMDEPFKGLDLALKISMFKLFNKLRTEEERTVVFVTHDIHEAILLGDEVILLSKHPVYIVRKFVNSTNIAERNLSNPSILALEKELYAYIS